ncbi:MAG: hypothetical protein ACI4EE_13925 [Lachnospiraceae bacterium]
MGIIIPSNKSKHFDELIVTNKFDDIFRNIIREYYIYGFKHYAQIGKAQVKQQEKHWEILKKVFGDKWEFIKRGKGSQAIRVIQLETESNCTENPLDELYFFHNLSSVVYYLDIILSMDENTIFFDVKWILGETPKEESKKIDELFDSCHDDQGNEYSVMDSWIKRLKKWKNIRRIDDISNQSCVMMKSQLSELVGYIKPDALEKKIKELARLGILRNHKQRKGERDYWTLSPITMKKMIQIGRNEYRTMIPDEKKFLEKISFERRFLDMCEFFSQYYMLGEIGSIVRKRLQCIDNGQETNVFRFKHNYLQKSLYDYNLIDLLYAIEEEKYCWIQYTKALDAKYSEKCIFPLEVRLNVVNGREYILFYDIKNNSIGSLRIEFIDKIVTYKSVETIEEVIYNLDSKEERECLISIQEDVLKKKKQTAKAMLPYIFGVEVSDCQVDDEWETRLKTYQFTVDYDEKEMFIKSRLDRKNRSSECDEKNIGIIHIKCFPTKELRQWIRSFYSRIYDIQGADDINYQDDVKSIWDLYFDRKELETEYEEKPTDQENYQTKYNVIGTKQECMNHEELFHEIFSNYSVVLANSVLACFSCKSLGSPFIRDTVSIEVALEEQVRKMFSYYTDEEVNEITSSLLDFITEKSQLIQSGRTKPRYLTRNTDYLYELLPITNIERRWLLSVFQDPLAQMFFPKEVLKPMYVYIQGEEPYMQKPFERKVVKYFNLRNPVTNIDGFSSCISEGLSYSGKEISFLRKVYKAMRVKAKVNIKYLNSAGKRRCRVSAPAWIEYSHMDGVFRVCDVYRKKGQMCNGKINVPRIQSLKCESESSYNLKEEQNRYIMNCERSIKTLHITFYWGKRNLPDRILTELSLWKKKCIYDKKTGRFDMTLYYPEDDQKDILIRLMGYGSYIKIWSSDSDDYICTEIKRRIESQREKDERIKNEGEVKRKNIEFSRSIDEERDV